MVHRATLDSMLQALRFSSQLIASQDTVQKYTEVLQIKELIAGLKQLNDPWARKLILIDKV